MPPSALRRSMIILGACLLVLGLLLPLVFSIGPSDPLGAYRAPDGATARGEIAEVRRVGTVITGLRVRHPGQRAGAEPVSLSDYGLLPRGWDAALPAGTPIEVGYVRARPESAAIPAALLEEVPAPEAPGLFAPLAILLGYVGAGIWLIVKAIRTPAAVMAAWMPVRPRGAPRPNDPRARAVAYKIVAGAMAVLLLPLLLLGIPGYVSGTLDAVASRNWTAVPGTIVRSRVEENTRTSRRGGASTSRAAAVEARYAVAGRTYRTDRVRFEYLASGGEEDARATVARYPVGATVTLRHDPADPARAVLEPGPVMPETALYGALALAALLGWLLAVWMLFRPLPPVPAGAGVAVPRGA